MSKNQRQTDLDNIITIPQTNMFFTSRSLEFPGHAFAMHVRGVLLSELYEQSW